MCRTAADPDVSPIYDYLPASQTRPETAPPLLHEEDLDRKDLVGGGTSRQQRGQLRLLDPEG